MNISADAQVATEEPLVVDRKVVACVAYDVDCVPDLLDGVSKFKIFLLFRTVYLFMSIYICTHT